MKMRRTLLMGKIEKPTRCPHRPARSRPAKGHLGCGGPESKMLRRITVGVGPHNTEVSPTRSWRNPPMVPDAVTEQPRSWTARNLRASTRRALPRPLTRASKLVPSPDTTLVSRFQCWGDIEHCSAHLLGTLSTWIWEERRGPVQATHQRAEVLRRILAPETLLRTCPFRQVSDRNVLGARANQATQPLKIAYRGDRQAIASTAVRGVQLVAKTGPVPAASPRTWGATP